MKFELNGIVRAISGKSNRVMVRMAEWLEIYDIDKDTSKLICQIDTIGSIFACALNENGSEAAFVGNDHSLQILEVDKVVGVKADQFAIIEVLPVERIIYQLLHDDENKLHVLHDECKVSLFNRSTKKFIPLEAPQTKKHLFVRLLCMATTFPSSKKARTWKRMENSSTKRL